MGRYERKENLISLCALATFVRNVAVCSLAVISKAVINLETYIGFAPFEKHRFGVHVELAKFTEDGLIDKILATFAPLRERAIHLMNDLNEIQISVCSVQSSNG